MAEVRLKISAEDKATAVLEKMAANGTNVTDRLQGAFDKLGIKSADSIESSRREIVSAFDRIKNSGVASADEIERAHKAMQGKLDDLSEKGARKRMGAWDGFKKHAVGAIGAIGAAWGASMLARSIFDTNREFQQLNASLITVTGSQAAANEEFAWIEQFATTTPYQLSEVTGAFIKLKAMGLEPSAESLRSYGNTAAAMGKSLDQMIEAVADAATGEFERLKEFGIKASLQGDQVTFTFKGVETTVENSSAAIQGYLLSLGNTDFASGMENQMNTIDGALSNLADEWAATMREIGENGLNDAIQQSLKDTTEILKDPEFRSALQTFAQGIAELIPILVEGAQQIMSFFNTLSSQVKTTSQWFAAMTMGDVGVWEWMTTGNDEAAARLAQIEGRRSLQSSGSSTAFSDFLGVKESSLFPGMTTSYAVGTAYVPRTGYYQLHRGEEVRTRGESSRGSGQSVTIQGGINITLPNVREANPATARDLARALEPELRKLNTRYRN